MAYVAPNTTIKFYTASIDPSYEHVRHFDSTSARDEYFNSAGIFQFSVGPDTYQNYGDGIIRVAKSAGEIGDCNYISFINSSHENRIYYAFITNRKLISEKCTEIEYKIDSFMTYWGTFHRLSGYCLRTHEANDYVGANIEPEPVNINEYITRSLHSSIVDTDGVMLFLSELITGIPGVTIPGEAIYHFQNHYFQGWMYPIADASSGTGMSNLGEIISAYRSAGKVNSILSAYQIPSWSYNPGSGSLGGSRDYTILNTTAGTLGGYVPRNAKLYTSPFRMMRRISSNGDVTDFKYELMNSNSITFRERAVVIGDPSVVCEPLDYQITGDQFISILTGFPRIGITKDVYAEWWNQNGDKAIANIIGQSVNFLATSMTAPQLAPSALASTIGAVTDVATAGASAQKTPVPFVGSLSTDASTALSRLGWKYFDISVNANNAETIDNFFDRYGYAQNKIMTPNTKVRSNFTYIKMKNYRVGGALPLEAANEISDAFNRGVTFWNNQAYFMNFTSSIIAGNRPI